VPIKGNGGVQPLDISHGKPIGIGAPKRDQILRPTQPLIPEKKLAKLPAIEENLESRRFGLLDPTTIALVSIVAMLTFIVIVSIPAAAIYFPRLIWFAEHLIDHPTLIIVILVIVTFALLLFFPLFGTRRRKALSSLRLLVFPDRRAEF
jgi:hypothetical protein